MRVLILGGTGEATALAHALAGDARFEATLSLAGRTRSPVTPPIPYRIGGFGGVAGLAAYLGGERIAALIDATHPFAAQMSRHAVLAAELARVPLLRISRSPWQATPDDHWTVVPDMAAAAEALVGTPRRVFLTIGQKDLAAFAAAPWHDYLVRSVDPPDPAALPPRATVIVARGPFEREAERTLLRQHRIEVVVTKNSGGSATVGKLIAARTLGLPVIMVERPPALPGMSTVADSRAGLEWLTQLHGGARPERRGV